MPLRGRALEYVLFSSIPNSILTPHLILATTLAEVRLQLATEEAAELQTQASRVAATEDITGSHFLLSGLDIEEQQSVRNQPS